MSTPADRLKQARMAANYRFAASAADALGVNRETYTQHENGTRAFNAERAAAYARRFKTTPEWLLYGSGPRHVDAQLVPILGFVGANPDGTILFATGEQPNDWAPVPAGGTEATRALEVRGHSMPFWADDGALIYFDNQRTAPDQRLLGQIVVVELDTGEVLLKRLLRGSEPGLFDLESLMGPTRRDAKINWVAEIVCVVPPIQAQRLIQRGG